MTRHATPKPPIKPIRAVTLAKSVATTSASAKSGPAKSGAAKSGAIRPALRAPAAEPIPFWKRKSLEQMTAREWESLCDGCGRCCLNKLEEEGTQKIHFTDVACKLLDHDTCRCKDYRNRLKKVPDCVGLTPAEVRELDWLPPTCAYDRLAKGKDLYWWHPLLSGDPETVHAAGISVRGRVGACESQVPDDQLENWVVSWPGKVPKGAGAKAKPVVAEAKKRAGKVAVEGGKHGPKRKVRKEDVA